MRSQYGRSCLTGNRWKVAGVIFLIIVIVISNASALLISENPSYPRDTSDPDLHEGPECSGLLAAPGPVITIRPTPTPARQNRTSILPIVKNTADRQKIALPAFWFVVIVGLAAFGLLTLLYLLIRRGSEKPPAMGKRLDGTGGKVTVIEPAESAPRPPKLASPMVTCPAVEFPPSLEKRFRGPVFIGEGGLARVFRAENARTGTTVAVKVPVRFDEVTGTHFTRDIVFWQGLEHENIIRIYSSNILPVPYIEMEYAPASLAHITLPLPEDRAVSIVLGVARGLAFAHAKGIVHRDIKPENILLTPDDTPKITDWGLGKAIGDTRQSTMIGFSPAYAAPEQIAPHRFGKPGPATDIYQTGMLLCEVLTGSSAFHADGMHDLNMAILEETPMIPSWNGRHEDGLRAIILRCLKKRPEERYGSADDLIRDLENVKDR